MSAPIGTRAGKHRPASHPVLRRGLGTRGSWEAQLIREIEDAVAALTGVELPEVLLDRYERALTRGHVDNLARIKRARK